MLNEIPEQIKTDVLFHQFGNLVHQIPFFGEILDNNCTWELLKKLTNVYYDEKDTIYQDNSFPEAVYMIELGRVQLFDE